MIVGFVKSGTKEHKAFHAVANSPNAFTFAASADAADAKVHEVKVSCFASAIFSIDSRLAETFSLLHSLKINTGLADNNRFPQ